MEWIEGCSIGAEFWQRILPAGFLTDLWIEGIWSGLGGVVIFIPQIAVLFLFVALMEDTGYMARVSFITDKALRKFGLQGRSVVPLLGDIHLQYLQLLPHVINQKDSTILVLPFMTCSARLPVYVLLIALVIRGVFSGILIWANGSDGDVSAWIGHCIGCCFWWYHACPMMAQDISSWKCLFIMRHVGEMSLTSSKVGMFICTVLVAHNRNHFHMSFHWASFGPSDRFQRMDGLSSFALSKNADLDSLNR